MRWIVTRVDEGSAQVRDALRAYGVEVVVIGRPVDWLCGVRGRNYLLEFKTPGRRRRRDQKKQDLFLATWPGQVVVVKTLDEALKACEVV